MIRKLFIFATITTNMFASSTSQKIGQASALLAVPTNILSHAQQSPKATKNLMVIHNGLRAIHDIATINNVGFDEYTTFWLLNDLYTFYNIIKKSPDECAALNKIPFYTSTCLSLIEAGAGFFENTYEQNKKNSTKAIRSIGSLSRMIENYLTSHINCSKNDRQLLMRNRGFLILNIFLTYYELINKLGKPDSYKQASKPELKISSQEELLPLSETQEKRLPLSEASKLKNNRSVRVSELNNVPSELFPDEEPFYDDHAPVSRYSRLPGSLGIEEVI